MNPQVERVHRVFDKRISEDSTISDRLWVRIMKHLNDAICEVEKEVLGSF